MDWHTYFQGKKITVMGLGLLGRGVGDAEFLARHGAELIVTDLKSEVELAPSLARLKKYPNITYRLGKHDEEDFRGRDMIIKAAGVPLDSPYIAVARDTETPVEMDASLFVQLAPVFTVGITGTRGKSTTSKFIYDILRTAGKSVYLAGNVRDTATLSLLEMVDENDIVVMELDSWQLQGFEEAKISPHIVVWTNFLRDHMNYYRGDMDRYFRDKAAIVRFQSENDIFFTTQEICSALKARFVALMGTCDTECSSRLPVDWVVALPGLHNRENAAYALAVARTFKIPDDISRTVFEQAQPMQNRLQYLGEKNGLKYYNDSNATTPDATIAAVMALKESGRPIILICGGSDKELMFEEMAKVINENVKEVVCFKGTATEKLLPLLAGRLTPIAIAESMPEAFAAAIERSAPGDTILLSPGATSFGIFKNEYDRGDQFIAHFNSLEL